MFLFNRRYFHYIYNIPVGIAYKLININDTEETTAWNFITVANITIPSSLVPTSCFVGLRPLSLNNDGLFGLASLRSV